MLLVLLVIGVFLPLIFLCTLPLWKPCYDSPIKGDYQIEDIAAGITVARFKNFCMFDWDFPDDGHKTDKCITISKHEDVLLILNNFINRNPEASFILEKTPGGVRGWYGKPLSIGQWRKIAKEVNCDPLYIKMTSLKKCWACRISPKPNRANDYVSAYWCTVGAEPTNLAMYEEYRNLIKI